MKLPPLSLTPRFSEVPKHVRSEKTVLTVFLELRRKREPRFKKIPVNVGKCRYFYGGRGLPELLGLSKLFIVGFFHPVTILHP